MRFPGIAGTGLPLSCLLGAEPLAGRLSEGWFPELGWGTAGLPPAVRGQEKLGAVLPSALVGYFLVNYFLVPPCSTFPGCGM